MCAKLHTVAASNNRVYPTRSFYYCLFSSFIYGVVLRADSVRGEPRIQRNTSGEVATTSPPFHNKTALIAGSFREDFTQYDLHILVTAPFCCDRKARTACAQSFALWQQATIEFTQRNHFIIACSRHVYMVLFLAHIPFVVNRAFSATPAEWLQ